MARALRLRLFDLRGLIDGHNLVCDQPMDVPKNDLSRLIKGSITPTKLQRNWKAPAKALAIGVQLEEDPIARIGDDPIKIMLTLALESVVQALQSAKIQ